MPVVVQSEIQQVFITTKVHCWLMFNMLSSRILQPLSEDLLSIQSVPNLYGHMELFQLSCRTLHFCIGWPSGMLSVCSSSLLRLLWKASLSLAYHLLPQFDVICELFEVAFCAIIKAVDKALYQHPRNTNFSWLPDWSIDCYPLGSAFCSFSPTL